jgi:putative ABC transport system permease protein
LLVTRAVVGSALTSWVWVVPACIGVAFGGALAARLAAGAVAVGDRSRPGVPLWQKLWLDVIALVVSGLVYWLTARTGFSAVINPDSNPTLSLSVYMFLAPALLWIGSALLLVRLRGRLFAWLAPGRASTESGYLLASAARRARVVNRGLVLVALLLAFAVDLAIFTATYDQQARVDAQLTIGADVVISGARNLQPAVARVPGVVGTTALDHTYAYVGPDLQDTFAIDPATFTQGTSLRDSYFVGGTAAEMMSRLRSRPDAILVSKETVTDYSLRRGDLLKLRTLDHRTGSFHVVPFHVVGIVQEFPSAPRDSFMVANRDYILGATHDPGSNVVFAKTSGDPSTVAARIAAATKQRGAIVKNIRDQTVQTVSSITTVDLRGISKIESAFAIVLAAAAMALYVGVALVERRQEFATMAALGKTPSKIVAFVWSELALIVVASSALAAFLGWLLAKMLVAMMQHAFDPPPDHLALPWGSFAALLVATLGGAVVATLLATAAVRRLPLGAVLREE